MATSSKSCGKVDGARMRAKDAHNVKREEETPNIPTLKKYKCTSIKNAAYLNKAEVDDAQQETIKTEDTEKEALVVRSVDVSRDSNINVKRVSKPTASSDQTPKSSKGKGKYEKETVRCQEKISAEESNRLSKNNGTFSGKIVSKSGSSLDLIPMPCQFTEKTENMPARVVQQKDVESSTASYMLSRKVHGSLKPPSASSSWKKSKISKTDSVSDNRPSLEKIKQLENAAGTVLGEGSVTSRISSMAKDSENSLTIKRDECTRQDCAPEYTLTNRSPSHAGEEILKEVTYPSDRKEELHSTNSILSTHNKPFNSFTQNIFSQSLFDDVLDDQSTKDDLSDVCEPSNRQGDNIKKNLSKTVTEIVPSNANDTCEHIYRSEDQKQKSLVNNHRGKRSAEDLVTLSDVGRSARNSLGRGSTDLLPNNTMKSQVTNEIKQGVSHNSSFSIDTSTDILIGNTLHRNDQISLKESEEEMRAKSNSPKTVAGIKELLKIPPNSLPKIFNVEEKAEDGKFSTYGIQDVPSQQAEVEMPSKSIVSAQFSLAGIHGNRMSCLNDFESRFLLEETDRQLERLEPLSSPSINNTTFAEYNPVSENELLEQQAEEMQPEITDDLLIDLPQIFANELEAFDVRSECEKESNSEIKKFENLQFFEDDNSSNFEDLLLSQPSSIHSQNPLCEGHTSQGCTPIKREICLQARNCFFVYICLSCFERQ